MWIVFFEVPTANNATLLEQFAKVLRSYGFASAGQTFNQDEFGFQLGFRFSFGDALASGEAPEKFFDLHSKMLFPIGFISVAQPHPDPLLCCDCVRSRLPSTAPAG